MVNLIGLLIPFLGTMLGSAFVFCMRQDMPVRLQKALLGFASGVMVAASVWSLLIPAIEAESAKGPWAVMPAAVGFLLGILFLLAIDELTPHLHVGATSPEGPRSKLSRTAMLALAVTIHNLPEGMAVGVVLAGATQGTAELPMSAAIAVSLGIAIQNIPEGAIISMPLKSAGLSRSRAFFCGAASGIVEPLGALLTMALAGFVVPLLPYFLGFAAGAMLYVVVEELIPEMSQGEHSNIGAISFALGFTLMMMLDVALG